MTLSTAGKDYIAQQFGINDCMVHDGLSWIVHGSGGTQQSETGGTAQLIARLVTSSITSIQMVSPRTGSYTNATLISNNQNQTVDYDDAAWISNNDGNPYGETQYCKGTAGPTPTPGPTQLPPTTLPPGVAGTFTFAGAPSGSPVVSLMIGDIKMKQNTTDYHFEVNDLFIANQTGYKAYVAVRVKLFQGAQNSCPSSGEVFDGMDRVSTSRNVRIKTMDPGEILDINADFYQPAGIEGVHTVCLIVHGSYDKQSLADEVALIAG